MLLHDDGGCILMCCALRTLKLHEFCNHSAWGNQVNSHNCQHLCSSGFTCLNGTYVGIVTLYDTVAYLHWQI